MSESTNEKPRIYCFVNSGTGTDWQFVVGVAEDGTTLASHVSSSVGWAKNDIGMRGPDAGQMGDTKHPAYAKHYPQGYELVWSDDPKSEPWWPELLAKTEALAAARGAA